MPIQILPPRLANQIAAGEVVERPSSVVKELIENSLDSGATSIQIEIDKGGHKRIMIRDNGSGIHKDELALALSRHATSKIACLEDLEAINSLGFRGEALASISSVSRLTLSSKPQAQPQAWQASCEGRDMQVQLHPTAHPEGTSIEVLDLFFNTPARRKFLRAEKTEFAHIEEVIRGIALSRFDLSFELKHNAKLVRKYPAVTEKKYSQKRLAAICSKEFAESALELNSQYQQFELRGWLAQPELDTSHAQFQYFYVNGRVMRDKLINHAIRQAFESIGARDRHPSYVLYLTLPTDEVDVNVHPSKQEVRFHQSRLVHDFIYRALIDALQQDIALDQLASSSHTLPPVEPNHDYIKPLHNRQGASHEPPISYSEPSGISASLLNQKSLSQNAVNGAQIRQPISQQNAPSGQGSHHPEAPLHLGIGQWLRIDQQQILVKVEDELRLMNIADLQLEQLMLSYATHIPVSQPLLLPVAIKATAALLAQAKRLDASLLQNSVEIGWTAHKIILRKVPATLRQSCWIDCFEQILGCQHTEVIDVRRHLLSCLMTTSTELTDLQVDKLWHDLSPLTTDDKGGVKRMGKAIDLEKWFKQND